MPGQNWAARVAAAYKQKLVAEEKKRQVERARPVIELDRKLIVFLVLIVALPAKPEGATGDQEIEPDHDCNRSEDFGHHARVPPGFEFPFQASPSAEHCASAP